MKIGPKFPLILLNVLDLVVGFALLWQLKLLFLALIVMVKGGWSAWSGKSEPFMFILGIIDLIAGASLWSLSKGQNYSFIPMIGLLMIGKSVFLLLLSASG